MHANCLLQLARCGGIYQSFCFVGSAISSADPNLDVHPLLVIDRFRSVQFCQMHQQASLPCHTFVHPTSYFHPPPRLLSCPGVHLTGHSSVKMSSDVHSNEHSGLQVVAQEPVHACCAAGTVTCTELWICQFTGLCPSGLYMLLSRSSMSQCL